MADYALLLWTPALSAGLFFLVTAAQIVRGWVRTWTEALFVIMSFQFGAYCLSDAIFFTSTSADGAHLAAVFSHANLTLAVLFLFLYGTAQHRGFRPRLLLALAPTAAALAALPLIVIAGVAPSESGFSPFAIRYDIPALLAWVAFLIAIGVAGLRAIYGTYGDLRRHDPKLARSVAVIVGALLLAGALGVTTNLALALRGLDGLPVFSSALAAPALLLAASVSPEFLERFNTNLLRRRTAEYAVRAAYLAYNDGTVIGYAVSPGQEAMNEDLFVGTLDLIQRFLSTAFPVLRSKFLRSINLGDHVLAVERGRHAFLAVLLRGKETDQLRRYLHDALRGYESRNEAVLAAWQGRAADTTGTFQLLEDLLAV